jgi:DNA-binding transcriptional regulator YiaG
MRKIYKFDGDELRRLRLASGLNRTQLAASLDRVETTVRFWETERLVPSADALIRICMALGCEPFDLMIPVDGEATAS